MSQTVVYILVGAIGVFCVLPRAVWFIASQIHQYIHDERPLTTSRPSWHLPLLKAHVKLQANSEFVFP